MSKNKKAPLLNSMRLDERRLAHGNRKCKNLTIQDVLKDWLCKIRPVIIITSTETAEALFYNQEINFELLIFLSNSKAH